MKSIPLFTIDKFNSLSWDKNSRLIIKGDGSNWVLSSIVKEMMDVCNNLNIKTVNPRYLYNCNNQCVFFTSKYEVLMNWSKPKHRVAFPYYHGNPRSNVIFKKMIEMDVQAGKQGNTELHGVSRIVYADSILEYS